MATNFKGYLLKFGNTIFPNEYLAIDKCKSIPDTRAEIEAYRDDYTQKLTGKENKGRILYQRGPNPRGKDSNTKYYESRAY